MFRKIKPKKVSDEIYEQLRNLVIKGDLKPGSKLPPERDLAVQLGVSRPSLREALNKLESQGFIEQIQGDGTYIKSFTQDHLDTAIDEFIKNDDAIFDLLEVRKTLETWSAYYAAKRATSNQLKEIKKYLNELKTAKEKGETGHEADVNFHYTITYAASNVLQTHLMRNIHDWVERVSYKVRSQMYMDEDAQDDLYLQHYNIYNAIKEKNPEAAYNAMREHLEYVEKHMREIQSKKV
jgi:GntR family transcriptional repressor for pyruvate dehydrogenase complex